MKEAARLGGFLVIVIFARSYQLRKSHGGLVILVLRRGRGGAGGAGCRLVLMGDVAQLPPVGQRSSPALDAEVLRSYALGYDISCGVDA